MVSTNPKSIDGTRSEALRASLIRISDSHPIKARTRCNSFQCWSTRIHNYPDVRIFLMNKTLDQFRDLYAQRHARFPPGMRPNQRRIVDPRASRPRRFRGVPLGDRGGRLITDGRLTALNRPWSSARSASSNRPRIGRNGAHGEGEQECESRCVLSPPKQQGSIGRRRWPHCRLPLIEVSARPTQSSC